MKKKSLILLLIMAVTAVMFFTACGKEKPTLESYMNEHQNIKASLDEQLGSDKLKNISVEFSGNDMIYTYDLAGLDNMTEEAAKSDLLKEQLQAGLDSQAEAFKNTVNSVLTEVNKDGAGIESINMIVNYTYDGEVIASGTYTSDPVSE